MTALQKAKLAEVDGSGKASKEVAVQFNPASLKLNRSNSIDAGKSRGRQVQQYNGTSSTTLTLELEFDTADQDANGEAVDVRTLTADITRFVLPGGKGSKAAPPRVRFSWGKFVLIGVMGSANEDLDLFSPEGVPLRAKVSVSIKEQDPKFEALEKGAGANPSTGAPPSGTPAPAGPGTSGGGSGPADRVAEAMDGESVADFLSRQGLLPEAWRSIADGVSDVLNLLPGEAIGFNLDLPLGGFSIGGGELSLGSGLEASLGLEVSTGAGSGAGGAADAARPGGGSGPDPAGFALSVAGGLTAAVQTAAVTTAGLAADANRQKFAAPARPAGPASGGQRPRLRDTAGARTQPAAPASAQPAPPAADRRASTYGSGLPLRERITPEDVRVVGSPWVVIGARQPAPAPSVSAANACGCSCRSAIRPTPAALAPAPLAPASLAAADLRATLTPVSPPAAAPAVPPAVPAAAPKARPATGSTPRRSGCGCQ
ncbi:hypothetical protein AB0L70_35810 [Kribbella sp. NPDC051952]|uniref:CIS tube protein n=1 Tax=Kribbella sp. NPDC051952 TaxID=3154851 RepID=UPI0034131A9D